MYITRSVKEENKLIFNTLLEQKNIIEQKFGQELVWEELPDKKASRIKFELNQVDYFNKEDWNKMIEFMVEHMQQLEKTFREPIMKLKNKLKTKSSEE